MAGASATVEQPEPELPAETSTKMPGRLRVVDDRLQLSSSDAAFARRASPRVVQNVRTKRRIRRCCPPGPSARS